MNTDVNQMVKQQSIARSGNIEKWCDIAKTWRYIAPAGTALQDCVRPDYWKHNLRELGETTVRGRHAFNRIEILAEDGSWEVDLRVMEIDRELEMVKLRVLRVWRDTSLDVALPVGYEIEFISGNGWRAWAPDGTGLIEKAAMRQLALDAVLAHSGAAAS
jgi:hypothetical protein